MTIARLRALEAALEILGSKVRLAEALGITIADLDAYLEGKSDLPPEEYFCALGIAANRETARRPELVHSGARK